MCKRVDLHTNGLLIVAGAEHARGPAQRRRERQSVVARHPHQHPDHRAVTASAEGRRAAAATRPGRARPRRRAVARSRAARRPRRAAPSTAAMCTAGGSPTSARASSSDSACATGIPADQRLHGRDRRLGDHRDDTAVAAMPHQRRGGHPSAQRILGGAQVLSARAAPSRRAAARRRSRRTPRVRHPVWRRRARAPQAPPRPPRRRRR